MARRRFVLLLVALSCFMGLLEASPVDADPVYHGSNGTAEQTVATTVWSLEKKKKGIYKPWYQPVKYHVKWPFKRTYGIQVCVAMGTAQIALWEVWAGVTHHHPSCLKVWVVVLGGALAMLLETYDFPPYQGLVQAHELRYATTIPLTYLWWS